MRKIEIPADVKELNRVIGFFDELLEEHGCPMKAQFSVELTVEEIFVNIASYAYEPGTNGTASISADVDPATMVMTAVFEDSGIFYDPLAKEDPDITVPASQRQIGGLGIFLVKKNMDDVKYEYKDGKNVLTISKKLL